jgi:hypothetical protein
MTSHALRKLLAPKVKAPSRPVTWIKLNRHRCYHRLVIPPCSVCGSETAEVVWYRCDNGGVRCLACRDERQGA